MLMRVKVTAAEDKTVGLPGSSVMAEMLKGGVSRMNIRT